MAILEIIKIVSEVGAIAVALYVIYLFVCGKIMSDHSVKKITDAQGSHMEDLKGEITTLRKDWGGKLDKAVDLLEEIRDNGAMNNPRRNE